MSYSSDEDMDPYGALEDIYQYEYQDEVARKEIEYNHDELYSALNEISDSVAWDNVLKNINNSKFINAFASLFEEEESYTKWVDGTLDSSVNYVFRIINRYGSIKDLSDIIGVAIYKVSNGIIVENYASSYEDLLLYSKSITMTNFLRSQCEDLMEYDTQVYNKLKEVYDDIIDRGLLLSYIASPDNNYKLEILRRVFDENDELFDTIYSELYLLEIDIAAVIMCEYANSRRFSDFLLNNTNKRPVNYIINVQNRSSNTLSNVNSLLMHLGISRISLLLQDAAESNNEFIFFAIYDGVGRKLTEESFEFILTSAVIGGNVTIINRILSDKRLNVEFESGYITDLFFYAINGSNALEVSRALLESGKFNVSDFKLWLDELEDSNKKTLLDPLLQEYI